jgi:hypothetical protein
MEVKQQKMMSDMFEQAMETCNNAFKTGVKMQEEVAKWWGDLLGETSPVQDWQKRTQAIITEAIPLAQRSAEEGMRVIDQNYRSNLDLLKKMFDAAQSDSMADARDKVQGLWEASLNTLRTNAQTLVQANAKVMESWSEFAKKNFDGGKLMESRPASKSTAAAK